MLNMQSRVKRKMLCHFAICVRSPPSYLLLEGLELDPDVVWDILGGCPCILVEDGLEPAVSGSVEVTRGKEDLLGLGGEEFGAA